MSRKMSIGFSITQETLNDIESLCKHYKCNNRSQLIEFLVNKEIDNFEGESNEDNID